MKVKSSQKTRRKIAPGNFTERLVKIGGSSVVRIPKALVERAGLTKRVAISMRGKDIVIRSAPDKDPRAGWEEQIKREIEKHGPPDPIDPDWEYMRNEFDEKEWTW